jgi:hypothetical protein
MVDNKNMEVADWLSDYPSEIADEMVNEILDNPQATVQDEISQGIGRFGLDPTNPIPIFGVPNNRTYLNKLRLDNGEKIMWRRMRSLTFKNIEFPVDEYAVHSFIGYKVTTLYLSSYHLRTSNKAPEGFILL